MAEGEDAGEVRNEEDLSPECLAWADSCIVSFPDDSDNNNWGNFRDALTEIIDIHPEIFVPSSTGTASVPSPDEDMSEAESIDMREADSANIRNNSSNEEVSEIVSLLTFESDPSKNSLQDHYFPESVAENGRTVEPVDDHARDLEGVESIEDDGSVSNGGAEAETSQVFKDDFMSTYIQDNVADFHVSQDPFKVTPQEIFKVWDLEIVGVDDDEEDGLVLQLKKALDESSTVQPLNDDQVVAGNSSIDDLIAGISDLSLTEAFVNLNE
ncbi:hypothetical protein EUTSA_v10027283mg [Eutrema salsugineum]|uniref:Uncharacterized protein n=1 Tax=Eutrema salsugineum TaxID=72664 RepID=V4P1G2_EUTSA|nr:uncharacterized protein LOC18028344 [Eutrema salsugineum]ESQ53146.1 hypothetical protein EUTSA_v10027283mg [Eutrema salsugineum]